MELIFQQHEALYAFSKAQHAILHSWVHMPARDLLPQGQELNTEIG